MVYLDNAATTKVRQEAVDAAVNAMEKQYGNPSSLHRFGLEAENIVTAARKIIAKTLGCTPAELFFTSGATESSNLAILGGTQAMHRRGNRVVTTTVEHPATGHPFDKLEKQGLEVIRISPRENGKFAPEDFVEAVNDQTILVSCMYVNNETGLILPIEEIGKKIKRKSPNLLFHVDAVQAFGKLPFQVGRMPVDMMSISGHKIYAPKGIGAFYLKKGVRVLPRNLGGGQEKGLRSGTESVPMIAGFGAAIQAIAPSIRRNLSHYQELNHYLREQLQGISGIVWNSQPDDAPYICNFSVLGIRSEIMLHFLEQKEIYVSSGSACSKGAHSGVLSELGCSDQQVDSALRISFSYETTKQDLDCLIAGLQEGMATLARQK